MNANVHNTTQHNQKCLNVSNKSKPALVIQYEKQLRFPQNKKEN